jgi:hypothetical protein
MRQGERNDLPAIERRSISQADAATMLNAGRGAQALLWASAGPSREPDGRNLDSALLSIGAVLFRAPCCIGEENPLVDSFTCGFSYDWHGAINVPGARSRRVVGASSGMGGYRAGRSTYWRREIAAPIVAAFQSTKS